MDWKDHREEIEAEYDHLQWKWEEELFGDHPDWEQLEQWNEELRGCEEVLKMMNWEELG